MEQKATTFREMMEDANNAGAFTAEQIEELYRLPKPATKHQLTTLQEVMGRKHSTSFESKKRKAA